MAVGGLPSKRQGRLGRPKDHRRPRTIALFIFSANPLTLHPHLLPSSPFLPLSFFFNSFFFPACSLSSSLSFSLAFSFSSSLACSLSSSFSFPVCSLACSLSYSFSFLILFPSSVYNIL